METTQTELFPRPDTPPPLMTGLDPVAYQPDAAKLRHAAIHREVEAALRHIVETRPHFAHYHDMWSASTIALACGSMPQSMPLTYDQVVMRHRSWCGQLGAERINELMADAANAVLEGCNSGAEYHSASATRGICEMFGIDYDAIVARVDGEGQA